MPRPIAFIICSVLLILFLLLAVIPAFAEYGRREAGMFDPDLRLDPSQVRVIEPNGISLMYRYSTQLLELALRHRAAHEAKPSDWFGID